MLNSIADIFRVLITPNRFWREVAENPRSLLQCNVTLLVVNILPATAWYFGTTIVGWDVADRTFKLHDENAGLLSFMFYLSVIVFTYVIAYYMSWMAGTYGSKPSFHRSLIVAVYSGMPIYLAGTLGVYPIFWLDIIFAILAGIYTVLLLYKAIPVVMKVPKDRGFLYASSLLASGAVMTIALMGVTTVIWEYSIRPVFLE